MLTLSTDHTFQYELMRVLGGSRDYAADVGEVLQIAPKIIPGDFESWYKEFKQLADHVSSRVDKANRHPVSVRNALFRAANYYRTADFFLHGNPSDPRINDIWKKATSCFDRAISLLDIPGERIQIKGDEFEIPAIFFRCSNDKTPRPVLLLCNGFDGSQEEMFHVFGFAALERGFHVMTFEGPGQPTVLREQNLGFINEWEKVVTPVVSYLQGLSSSVDPSQIALLGYSFGGYLAPRAAAFENRLGATICVDGLYDINKAFTGAFTPEMKKFYETGMIEEMNQETLKVMQKNTNVRWAVEHGSWSFKAKNPYDFIERTRNMTMKGITENIKCPLLICDAEDDQFFKGQPEQLAAAMGARATHRKLSGGIDAAGDHCHVGANDLIQSVVMDWLEDVFEYKKL